MTHIFLNGLGASAGAGLTYLYNVVPRLASWPGVRTTLAVQPQLRPEFKELPNVNVIEFPVPGGSMRRFWLEQARLPELVRESGAGILLSAGNFAIRKSPVPQILLSGNSLYTSGDFYRDLHRRREFTMWLDTRIKAIFARKSVLWADRTIAPSQAFAADLRRWTGKDVLAVHHGFDPDVFFDHSSSLPPGIAEQLQRAAGRLKLLFVSHYNYYRNFETLFRALRVVRDLEPGLHPKLFLTCTLDDTATPGAYKTATARDLIRDLQIGDEVVELGAIPYRQLHHLYRACDVYVTPAYAETFAHPLVEATACGLPVIASDIPTHREICKRAVFFDRFSPDDLARRVIDVAHRGVAKQTDPATVKFSWSDHVAALLEVANELQSQVEPGEAPEPAGKRSWREAS